MSIPLRRYCRGVYIELWLIYVWNLVYLSIFLDFGVQGLDSVWGINNLLVPAEAGSRENRSENHFNHIGFGDFCQAGDVSEGDVDVVRAGVFGNVFGPTLMVTSSRKRRRNWYEVCPLMPRLTFPFFVKISGWIFIQLSVMELPMKSTPFSF